jgi:hypothetical protein
MPASAANQTGSVQMKWNVAATATMTLVTNYTAGSPAAQGLGANSLLPSVAATTCTSQSAETAFTLTFGALTPSSTAEVGCTYQRAIAATVTTNDSSGYKIQEWLDQAPTAGIQFCAIPNNTGVATVNAPASVTSGNPAATANSCPNSGTVLVAGTAASGSGGGNPGTAGIRTATAPGSPYTWASTAAVAANLVYGEDIQIGLAANQASSASDTSYVIISLIPN